LQRFFAEKSLAIQREIGDRAGEGRSLHNIAHIHWQNQAIEAAVANFSEACKIARETNAADLLFAVSRDLGNVLCQLGQKSRACRCCNSLSPWANKWAIPTRRRWKRCCGNIVNNDNDKPES